MIIENVGAWGEYPLWRAKWQGYVQYGTTAIQAISNMLGLIMGEEEYNPEIHGL